MKKIIFSLLLLLPFVVNGEVVEVKDQEFKKCLVDELNNSYIFDTNNRHVNNQITSEELSKITSLSCNERYNIENINELGYLTNLKDLFLNKQNIKSIDFTKNKALETVSVINGVVKLVYLDNPNIIHLELENNNIDSISLASLTNLKKLYLGKNKLSGIDLSKNANLELLSIDENELRKLSLVNNPKLTYLNANNNKMEVVNISKNTMLNTLLLSQNNLSVLDLTKHNSLKKLDVNFNSFIKPIYELKPNSSLTVKFGLKLPSKYKLTQSWFSYNKDIVTFENWIFNAKKPGTIPVYYSVNIEGLEDIYHVFDSYVVVNEDSNTDYTLLEKLYFINSIANIDFKPNVTEYNTYVLFDTTYLELMAVPLSNNVNVEIEGNKNLNVGNNQVYVTVTDKNEKSKKYTINVLRLEDGKTAPTLLNNITIENYNINFNKDIKEYTLKIANDIDKLNIKFDKYINTDVKVDGNEDLKDGSVITITTSLNNEKIVYTINISKEQKNMLPILIAVVASVIILIIIIIVVIKKKNKNKQIQLEKETQIEEINENS